MEVCDGNVNHVWRTSDLGTFCRGCGLVGGGPGPEGDSHSRPWAAAAAAGASRCFWCRMPFTRARPPTFDHVVPVSAGGTRDDGLVFSCQTCNGARGNIPFDEYVAAVEAERERAALDGREYRRPKRRLVGGGWVVTTMSRREIAAWNAGTYF